MQFLPSFQLTRLLLLKYSKQIAIYKLKVEKRTILKNLFTIHFD